MLAARTKDACASRVFGPWSSSAPNCPLSKVYVWWFTDCSMLGHMANINTCKPHLLPPTSAPLWLPLITGASLPARVREYVPFSHLCSVFSHLCVCKVVFACRRASVLQRPITNTPFLRAAWSPGHQCLIQSQNHPARHCSSPLAHPCVEAM